VVKHLRGTLTMQIQRLAIPDLILITPDVYRDERGYFQETWHGARYAEYGIPEDFVQDNEARSSRGVLRGLHYQLAHPQGKLVRVVEGEVFDIAVDIRIGSPTFRKWKGVRLNSELKQQLYVPPGFAHGYCVLSETALFSYKCTEYYHPEDEYSLLWNDPDLGIEWPVERPIVSPKDQAAPRLKEINPADLFGSQ